VQNVNAGKAHRSRKEEFSFCKSNFIYCRLPLIDLLAIEVARCAVSENLVDFRPDFSGQDFFYLEPVLGRKPEANAAVGTYVAGNGDQLAGNARFLKEFFRAHGVAYRFKERHGIRFLVLQMLVLPLQLFTVT
jgi:hypothetical protein